VLYRTYTTVVRPIITDTVMVWWPRVNTKPTVPTSQTAAIEDGSYSGTCDFWRSVTAFKVDTDSQVTIYIQLQ